MLKKKKLINALNELSDEKLVIMASEVQSCNGCLDGIACYNMCDFDGLCAYMKPLELSKHATNKCNWDCEYWRFDKNGFFETLSEEQYADDLRKYGLEIMADCIMENRRELMFPEEIIKIL